MKSIFQPKTGFLNFLFILITLSTWWLFGTEKAWSFTSVGPFDNHGAITKRALEHRFFYYNFQGFTYGVSYDADIFRSKIGFSPGALREIAKANRNQDNGLLTGVGPFSDHKRHFDNETLVLGSLYLIELKNSIVSALQQFPPNGSEARRLLGQALHTIQDYYSHTNWVENGNVIPNPVLGESKHAAPPSGNTCPTYPSVLGGAGTLEITSGYYIQGEVCDPVIRNNSNKCIHGENFIVPNPCDGLHKDHDFRFGFQEAKFLATEATKNYVNKIIAAIPPDDLLNGDTNKKDQAIGALMDAPVCIVPTEINAQQEFAFCSCRYPFRPELCECILDEGAPHCQD